MLLDLTNVHNFHCRMINVVSFCVNNSSSHHTDYKKKDGPANEQDDITITAEAKYSVNIIQPRKKSCSSLHYNAAKKCLYDNGVKIHQFKALKKTMSINNGKYFKLFYSQ